jgi:predicted DNA binding protein
MPFCNLSKALPESEIHRWCNLEVDILELSHENYSIDYVKATVESILKQVGAELLHVRLYKTSFLEAVIRCRCTTENSTISIIEKSKAIPVMPITYRHGLEYLRFIAYSEKDLRFAMGQLSKVSQVDVLKRGKIQSHALDVMTVSLREIFGSLTMKQLNSLINAIELGYYAIPRKVTIGEIAKLLGVSRSTYEEHLRKAEVKLIQAMKPYLRLANLSERAESK